MSKNDFTTWIAKEMESLLVPGANAMACIIETPERKFVQFCNDPSRDESGEFDQGASLWLDIPCAGLTREESDRAAELLGKYGVLGPTEKECMLVSPKIPDDDGRFGFMIAWRLDCGPDPEKAARIAVEMPEGIYGVKAGTMIKVEVFEIRQG